MAPWISYGQGVPSAARIDWATLTSAAPCAAGSRFLATRSFTLLVNGTYNFGDSGLANGENKYLLVADPGFSIKTLAFTFSPGIEDIRQIRTVDLGETAPVPEPATWAMMIVGFAGIGAMMRRSRRRVGDAVAA